MDNSTVKKSKLRLLFLNIGKLILDAVKLSFGGLVLAPAARTKVLAPLVAYCGIY